MPTSELPERAAGREPPRHSRAALWAVVALLAAHAVLVWLARPAGIETGGDDARYLLLGQALRHFRYVELWQVGHPVHSLYPPAFPVLLGLWGLVAGSGFDAQIVLSILCSVGSLLAAYLLARRHLEPAVAVLALAAVALNPALVARSGTIAAEMPYALWSALALLALLGRPTTRNLVLGAALAIVAALTRSVGVTLVAAVVLTLLLERRWTGAGWTAVSAAALLGPWFLWTVLAPRRAVGGSYVADALTTVQRHQGLGVLGTLVERVVHNGPNYAITFIETVLPYPNISGTRIDNWTWLAIGLAGLAAGLWAARRVWLPVVVYLVFYGALLLVWVWPVERFVEPVIALVVPLWLYGLWTLAKAMPIRRPVAIAAGAAAVVGLSGAWGSGGLVAARVSCGRQPAPPDANRCLYPAQLDWMAALRWVRDSAPPEAAVLTVKEGAFFLYSHHETVPFGVAIGQRPGRFLDYVAGHGGRYIVLSTVTLAERSRLAPLLAAACERLEIAAAPAPLTYVLRLRAPGPDSVARAPACAAIAGYQRAVVDTAAGKRWL